MTAMKQLQKVATLATAGVLSLGPAPAWGQGSRSGPHLGVGVEAGSLGLGAAVIVGVTRRLEVRGVGNYFKLTFKNQNISDIDYDVTAKWASGMLLADLYLTGALRVTGGLAVNGNKLTIDAKPTSDVTIGDSVYTPAEIGTITGSIDFKKGAPYLGLGVAGHGAISPVFELGVIFQQSPRVSYTPTTTLSGAAKTTFDQNAQLEAAKIQDDLNKPYFKYYPHVALGLTIRL
jgi:hypothetical protein